MHKLVAEFGKIPLCQVHRACGSTIINVCYRQTANGGRVHQHQDITEREMIMPSSNGGAYSSRSRRKNCVCRTCSSTLPCNPYWCKAGDVRCRLARRVLANKRYAEIFA